MKRTLIFFNPNERKAAEKAAAHYRKQGLKVVIETSPRWGTLDVRKVIRNKPKKVIKPKVIKPLTFAENYNKQISRIFG